MRVISQKGQQYRDFQYEQCNLSVVSDVTGCFVFVDTLNNPMIMVAQYSTEEKALKAMEMLHEAYTGMINFKNIEISDEDMEGLKEMLHRGYGAIAYCSNGNSAKIEPINTVFKFPQEDEIE